MVLSLSLCGIPISINECIGDSLHTINAAFTALDFRTSAITPPTTAGNVFLTTISGGNIILGGTGTTTIISGDTLITENLFLSGDALFYGDLTVDGTITGSLLSSTGDLTVDGNAYIYDKLTAAELSSTGDLTVDGNAYIYGKLTAAELSSTGDLTVDGNTYLKRNLDVLLDTTLKGNLSVYGNSFLGDNCGDFTQIQGTLKLPCFNSQNAIEFNNENTIGGIPASDGLVIRYETSLFGFNEDALLIEKTDHNQSIPAGGIAIRSRGNGGAPSSKDTLSIRGDGNVGLGTWYPNKTLTVIGEISATQNVQFNQDLQVDGNTILGDGGKNTTIKDDLFVRGTTTMDGNLKVLGDMEVLGNTTQLDTYVNITSSVDINCSGAVTALVVNQTGNTPVAHFKDDGNSALYIEGNTSGGVGGYVGIGTPNPTERLQVQGNIALSQNNGGSRGIFVPVLPANSTDLKIDTTNNIILQETNGNVGIGRPIPMTTLDVNGDVTITDKIIHSANTNTFIRFPSDDNFAIVTSNLDRVRVIDNGYVGINTITPNERLTVVGNISGVGNVNFVGVQQINANSNDPALRIIQDGSGFALRVDDVTGDGSPFVIDDDGNVGVKRDNPATALDVNGDVTITDKIIHDGDTDTCIRFPSNDNFAIETSNLDRVRVIANGYVGINTTTPNERLTVVGNISGVGNVNFVGVQEIVSNSSNPALKITQSGSGFALRVDDVTGDGSPFVIDDDGNVGVKRDNPATALDVNGDITVNDKIIHNGDTNTFIQFPSTNGKLTINTAGSERITVLPSGNVGINQPTPTEKLHVVGNIKGVGNVLFEGVQEIVSDSTDPALEITQKGAGFALRVNDQSGDTTTPFVIDADGNVGVKKNNPATALDVNGDVTITDKIIHDGDPNTFIRFPSDDKFTINTAGSERITVLPSGNVGINQPIPTERLEVSGNIQLTVPGSPDPNYRIMGLREAERNDILIGLTYDDDPVTLVTLRKFLFDEGASLTVGGNFQLTDEHHNRTYICNNGLPITITCPSGLKNGLQVSFIRGGAGEVTFANGAGTSLNSALNFRKLAFTNSAGTVYLGQTNTYYLFGDLLP